MTAFGHRIIRGQPRKAAFAYGHLPNEIWIVKTTRNAYAFCTIKIKKLKKNIQIAVKLVLICYN